MQVKLWHKQHGKPTATTYYSNTKFCKCVCLRRWGSNLVPCPYQACTLSLSYMHNNLWINHSSYTHTHTCTHKLINIQLLSSCSQNRSGRRNKVLSFQGVHQLTWCPGGFLHGTRAFNNPNKHFSSTHRQRKSSINTDSSEQSNDH